MEFDINPEWLTLIIYTHPTLTMALLSSQRWWHPTRCNLSTATSYPTIAIS
jgi:hypothetical protein